MFYYFTFSTKRKHVVIWRYIDIIHCHAASVLSLSILCCWLLSVTGFLFSHQLIYMKYTPM